MVCLRPKRAASGGAGLRYGSGQRGGSGQGRIVGRISSERVPCECRRLQHLHYFRVARQNEAAQTYLRHQATTAPSPHAKRLPRGRLRSSPLLGSFGVGVELPPTLRRRNLLIPRPRKSRRTCKSAYARIGSLNGADEDTVWWNAEMGQWRRFLAEIRGRKHGLRGTALESKRGEIQLHCPRLCAHVQHDQNRVAVAGIPPQIDQKIRIIVIQRQI